MVTAEQWLILQKYWGLLVRVTWLGHGWTRWSLSSFLTWVTPWCHLHRHWQKFILYKWLKWIAVLNSDPKENKDFRTLQDPVLENQVQNPNHLLSLSDQWSISYGNYVTSNSAHSSEQYLIATVLIINKLLWECNSWRTFFLLLDLKYFGCFSPRVKWELQPEWSSAYSSCSTLWGDAGKSFSALEFISSKN